MLEFIGIPDLEGVTAMKEFLDQRDGLLKGIESHNGMGDPNSGYGDKLYFPRYPSAVSYMSRCFFARDPMNFITYDANFVRRYATGNADWAYSFRL